MKSLALKFMNILLSEGGRTHLEIEIIGVFQDPHEALEFAMHRER
jgi:hypothetical protein